MTKTKFILQSVGYAVGKIAGLVLALWLVSCGHRGCVGDYQVVFIQNGKTDTVRAGGFYLPTENGFQMICNGMSDERSFECRDCKLLKITNYNDR